MAIKGSIDVNPEDVGVNSERLERLDRFFLESIEANHIQAAGYIISRQGKIFVNRTMGILSGIDDRGNFLPDSIHAIASATKVFTATAIMQLVEVGKLSLEQPVSTILSEFQNPIHEKITLLHLLTHTSGLRADPGAHTEPYPRPFWDNTLTSKNWISFVLRDPLQFPVGEVWNYCSHGFMILGEIIARISGVSYTKYIQKYILEPLGMTRSFFDVPDQYRPNVCIVNNSDVKELNFPRQDTFVESWVACGSLYSTLFDIWKFGQMILSKGSFQNHHLLCRKMVETMTRNHLQNIPAYNWGIRIKAKQFGIGWEIDKEPTFSPGTLSHEGFGWTSLLIDPQEELVYVSMTPTKTDWWTAKPMIARALALSALV